MTFAVAVDVVVVVVVAVVVVAVVVIAAVGAAMGTSLMFVFRYAPPIAEDMGETGRC